MTVTITLSPRLEQQHSFPHLLSAFKDRSTTTRGHGDCVNNVTATILEESEAEEGVGGDLTGIQPRRVVRGPERGFLWRVLPSASGAYSYRLARFLSFAFPACAGHGYLLFTGDVAISPVLGLVLTVFLPSPIDLPLRYPVPLW